MFTYLLIGAGGALGAISRVLIGSMLPETVFTSFPLRIIAVNIIGCFTMGFLIELLAAYYSANSDLKLFLTTGFLGGFTTFSSFALEFGQLTNKDLIGTALTYALLSVSIGLIAFFIGAKLAKLI
jgi:CrcB protein